MSAAVVSPASSTATYPRTRVTVSSLAAQAYAALQHDATQQIEQVPRHHRNHGGKASASPNSNAAQAATPNAGGALNILA